MKWFRLGLNITIWCLSWAYSVFIIILSTSRWCYDCFLLISNNVFNWSSCTANSFIYLCLLSRLICRIVCEYIVLKRFGLNIVFLSWILLLSSCSFLLEFGLKGVIFWTSISFRCWIEGISINFSRNCLFNYSPSLLIINWTDRCLVVLRRKWIRFLFNFFFFVFNPWIISCWFALS